MANRITKSLEWFASNEKFVMRMMGLNPTPGSGNGPLFKEDGYDDARIAQLKATTKDSYTIKWLDIKTLLANAIRSHKKPLFVVDFVERGQWVAMPIEDYLDLVKKAETNGE